MAAINLLYIIWDVSPEIFPPFPFPRWYGFCWMAGIMLSYQVMRYIFKRQGKPVEELNSLTTYLLIGALLGARLGHILFYDPIYYLHHPIEILPFRLYPRFEFTGFAGLASHGGAIGILIALYFYCRKKKENYLWMLDKVVIVGALAGSFIRLGNLMNSEIIGEPTTVPWAFVFTAVDSLPRHPAQLYESIFCLLLFCIFFFVWKSNGNTLANGLISGLFLIILFTQRIVEEFYKVDQEAFENTLPLNMGQLLSIPFVLLGLAILIKYLLERRRSISASIKTRAGE